MGASAPNPAHGLSALRISFELCTGGTFFLFAKEKRFPPHPPSKKENKMVQPFPVQTVYSLVELIILFSDTEERPFSFTKMLWFCFRAKVSSCNNDVAALGIKISLMMSMGYRP